MIKRWRPLRIGGGLILALVFGLAMAFALRSEGASDDSLIDSSNHPKPQAPTEPFKDKGAKPPAAVKTKKQAGKKSSAKKSKTKKHAPAG